MLRIVVLSESGSSFQREFDAESLTIGRSAAAGLTLGDNFLSREHARLYHDGDDLLVEDLGSRNGTKVNDMRIEGPIRLAPGDRIGLCSYTLTVETVTTRCPVAEPARSPLAPRQSPLEGSVLIPAAQLLEPDFDFGETVLGGLEAGDREVSLYLERLQLLDEVHRSLARSISLDQLLELILDRVFEHLGPEEGVVILKGADGGYEVVAHRRVSGVSEDTFFSETLIQEVAEKRQGALVMDAQVDERFAEAESILGSGVRSIVAAPLAVDDQSFGLVAMSSRLSVRQFEERDLELLGSLASVAALRLHNLALALEAAERQKLEAEMDLARTIQEELLPAELPEVHGYELAAVNRPSRGVSGDLYQVLETDSRGIFYLLLYDVSGKGLAASLLTATIDALSAGPIAQNLPPERVCGLINQRLESRTRADSFATAFLAQLETSTGVLSYASAGHNPALLIRALGEVERLPRTGPPLGVLADCAYEAVRLELSEDDLLVVYSDGITEARNSRDDEYGMERLERLCKGHRHRPISELATAIEDDVAEFVAGIPYDDDRTLLLVRRASQSGE